MVDARAEEDAFGAFSFAPTQINGPYPSTSPPSDDDDWGDFVESPLRSNLPNNTSLSAKPRGALPLSFFGVDDVAEGERSRVAEPTESALYIQNQVKGANGFNFSSNSDGVNFNGSKKSDSFNQNQVKVENGFNFSSSSGEINLTESKISDSFNQNWVKGENGFNVNYNSSGIGSDLNGKDLNFDLCGGKYGNRGVRIENGSGLSSDSDLFAKSRDFRSLEKGNLSGLRSDTDLFGVNDEVHSLQVKGLSELSLNFNMFAVNNGIQSPHVKDLNGLSSNVDRFAVNNGVHSPQVKDLSGLSSNIDMFAVNSGGHSPQVKDISGLSSNIDMFAVNNGVQTPQVKDLNGLSFGSDLLAVKNGNLSPQVRDIVGSNDNSDAFSQIKGSQSRIETASELDFNMDLFRGNNGNNLVGLHSNFNGLVTKLNPPSGDEEVDADDYDWEFKDAFSEQKVDRGINEKVNSKQQESPEATGISSQVDNGSHVSIDFSSASDGISVKPIDKDFSFDLMRSAVAQNGFSLDKTVAQNGLSSDSFFNSEQSGFDDGLNSDPEDSSEWFGNFQGAFTGDRLKEEDVSNTGNASHSEVEVLASNGKAQGSETRINNHKRALPLALFGDEELETDDLSKSQNDFAYKPTSTQRDGINSEASNYSIHDVISNLYSQAQQNPSVENLEKLNENGLNLNPSNEVLSHIPEDLDEDFDDDSWEFKDASAGTHTLELSSHLAFYRELEEKLSFVCRCHLDNLKKARDTAASSGENAKVEAIEEEIQEAYKELQEENSNLETHSDSQTLQEVLLNEFLEALHEPKFQVLESHYQLSRKLHLAQKDLKSAIEAKKHTKLKLNILTIGSSEDQNNYVSTWYKIISVCAQELKHGSWIWKQSIENNLQSRMVSEYRGKDFIISLVEVYRVVTILGASAKLYEPWILSYSVNSSGIFSLLEDCYALWSSLKIEEALEALHGHDEFQSTAKALLESIKHIYDLDDLALRDLVFIQQASTCRLSLLTSEVIPEIKMVIWGGETYFVTLANLWANLISGDLPKLPHLQVAS